MVLNRVCHANEVDEACLKVAVSRAKMFARYCVNTYAPYPGVHDGNSHALKHGGKDIYLFPFMASC